MEQITSIVEQITHWGLTGIWKILFAIIIWFVGKKVIALCMKFLKKVFDKGSLDPGVVNFTMSIIRFALYSVLILMVIDELGIQTTSLVTVFGSAALAIGMSLQGSLSNFAGGVLILIFKPFKVGDYIVVGNLEGTVRTIELLYTKLTTVDNKVVMLPNGALSNSNIVNVGAEDNRRLDIEMPIGYSSDLKLAKNILSDILAADNSILKDKEVKVIVKSLDESIRMENELKLSEERQQLFNFVLSELEQDGNLAHEKNAIQHGLTTVYEHSVGVAGASLKLAEFFHLKVNEKALIRGALLHDYFLYDWHIKRKGHHFHGFTHPATALRNAEKEYNLGDIERNIISRHMFPLTIVPPMCREAWLVCLADKYCAVKETFAPAVGY